MRWSGKENSLYFAVKPETKLSLQGSSPEKILSLFPSSSYTYDSSSNSTCDPVLQQSSRHVWTQLRAVFIPECSHPISLRVITLDIFLLITCSKDGIQRHFAHPNTFSRAIKVLFHSLLLSKRTRGHRSLLWL